jgi:hypothetical protein
MGQTSLVVVNPTRVRWNLPNMESFALDLYFAAVSFPSSWSDGKVVDDISQVRMFWPLFGMRLLNLMTMPNDIEATESTNGQHRLVLYP